MSNLPRLLFIMAIVMLSACASNEEKPALTEKDLYRIAQDNLENKSFTLAVSNLQLLESRFPFGPYAEQAQLEIIYAYYKSFEPEAAIESAERFIRLHPQHPSVDYAYYMRGLSAYSQSTSLFDRFLSNDPTRRDPSSVNNAFEYFRQLLIRHPNSAYAQDAKARMVYLRNRLARSEINVANYYFKRKAYVAAANRGRYVVEKFPQAPAVADALAVMIQAYTLLDMQELANDSLAILKINYPQHPSIGKNGEFLSQFSHQEIESKSLLNRLSFGLLDPAEPPKFDNRADYLR